MTEVLGVVLRPSVSLSVDHMVTFPVDHMFAHQLFQSEVVAVIWSVILTLHPGMHMLHEEGINAEFRGTRGGSRFLHRFKNGQIILPGL